MVPLTLLSHGASGLHLILSKLKFFYKVLSIFMSNLGGTALGKVNPGFKLTFVSSFIIHSTDLY